MKKEFNLKQIQVFYVASKYDSFKEAARHLKVSVAAISIQIKNLEEFLGFKLFVRKSTTVELTQKAKEILPIINEIFHQTDLLSRKIKSYKKPQDKKIVVGVHINPGRYLAPMFFRYVGKHLPQLELIFVNDDHPVSLKKLKSKEIDIMIMDGTISEDICLQKFIPFDVPYIVCPKNPILKKQPISLKEFVKIPSLFPSSISGYSLHVKAFYARHNIPMPSDTLVMSSILFPSLIANTKQGAFVNKLVVDNELKTGQVVELKLEHSPGPMNFYLGFLKESLKNKHIKALLNLLKDYDAFASEMEV